MSNCPVWPLPFCDTRARVAVLIGGQTTAAWLRLQPARAKASRTRGRMRAVSTGSMIRHGYAVLKAARAVIADIGSSEDRFLPRHRVRQDSSAARESGRKGGA